MAVTATKETKKKESSGQVYRNAGKTSLISLCPEALQSQSKAYALLPARAVLS